MKKVSWIFLVLVVGAYFLIYSPSRKEGKTTPDFKAELIDGTEFSLSDLRGQYVLLDFWGSWCPPCRKDNPNLVSLHNDFHNKSFQDASNFQIVTIALEKNDKRWKRAALKDGFIWKHQIVRMAKLVLTDPIAIKYGVKEVPSKFLIDPDGSIIGVNMKKTEIADYLTSRLKN